MVKGEIVLGHKISNARLEVGPMEIDVVSKLPLPYDVKPLRSFLGHTLFYRRFINGFFQITNLSISHGEKGCQTVVLLQEFDLEIIDCKGTENQVVDHLLHLHNEPFQCKKREIEDG
ncbi:hypothetical protein E5676_scaffold76994G00080 [Cucumis melo var. makuwa]|uniref:Uncharacterized protein n=1 Tax=Cucumis melo var. makuwa TaxID=1194695 RepID=A0A5D3C2Q4_CUCMM|nr:hypothetical protein E6C27_scaffold409G001190 [Cucumis melo var. makuwa]TYK04706.1 hypothetical protein E5676_scaffold76994G00080 [Cucumis melo var. makuwa]